MKFTVYTDRLILRVLTPESTADVLAFYEENRGDFEKYETTNIDSYYSFEHHRKVLDYEYKATLKLNLIRYFIFEKSNPNKIIGTVSYRNIVKPVYSSCIIGYKMGKAYRNKGYCSEAIKATLPLVTGELDIHRVEAFILPDNAPSIALAEKLGFVREGLVRDKFVIQGVRRDHYLYSYLADN